MAHPPKLIQANIALFAGEYAETRRLLNDFRSGSGGITPEDVPLVLWLDAQTQDDAGERLRHLRSLLAQLTSPRSPRPISSILQTTSQSRLTCWLWPMPIMCCLPDSKVSPPACKKQLVAALTS